MPDGHSLAVVSTERVQRIASVGYWRRAGDHARILATPTPNVFLYADADVSGDAPDRVFTQIAALLDRADSWRAYVRCRKSALRTVLVRLWQTYDPDWHRHWSTIMFRHGQTAEDLRAIALRDLAHVAGHVDIGLSELRNRVREARSLARAHGITLQIFRATQVASGPRSSRLSQEATETNPHGAEGEHEVISSPDVTSEARERGGE